MRPIIKICGLSSEAMLDAALDLGVERVGLVVFPASPRHVAPARARTLADRARGRAAVVTLVVDPDDATLDAVVDAARPDMIQLHGREPPARVTAIRARVGRPVVKAIGIGAAADLAVVPAYAAVADEILFDAKPPRGADRPGGNGAAFDWALLRALDVPVRFMLSGGLSSSNVAEAIAATGAPGVDVSSGVERAPGVKDAVLMAMFVAAARATAAPSPRGPDDPLGVAAW